MPRLHPKPQRRSPVLRVRGVRIDRTWPEWASTVAPHTVSWTTVGAVLVLMGVFRLLAEWQRRTTLVALMSHAPGGTVVIQQRGLGGPSTVALPCGPLRRAVTVSTWATGA